MIYIFLSANLILSYMYGLYGILDASEQDEVALSFNGVVSTREDEIISSKWKQSFGENVRLHESVAILPNDTFWSTAKKIMFTKQNITVESLLRLGNLEKSGHHRKDAESKHLVEPLVEYSKQLNESTIKLVIELNGDAFLPCRVGHLGDRQVSWIRKRDWFVLTSGKDTLYALHSNRFIVLHEEGSQDWILRIKNVEESDQGYYECQVSTGTGIISFLTHVQVVVPKAQLSGSRQLHINTGSSFFLRCFISKANPGLQHVNWLHNGKRLNYDVSAEGISIFTKTSKKKISHEYSESQEKLTNRYIIMSQIDVINADEGHSGNYTCQASHVKSDTAYVYVNEGDKTAAVQRIGLNSAPHYQSSTIVTSIIVLLIQR